MGFWVHIRRSVQEAILHRDRCIQVPSGPVSSDFWEGGWFEYADKEAALDALEQSGTTNQLKCSLCKP